VQKKVARAWILSIIRGLLRVALIAETVNFTEIAGAIGYGS
jgi:hypothetical protein